MGRGALPAPGCLRAAWIDSARHLHALLSQANTAPRIRQYISALSTYGGHQKLVLRGDETPKKGGGGGGGGGAGAGDSSSQRNVVQQREAPADACSRVKGSMHPCRVRAGPRAQMLS